MVSVGLMCWALGTASCQCSLVPDPSQARVCTGFWLFHPACPDSVVPWDMSWFQYQALPLVSQGLWRCLEHRVLGDSEFMTHSISICKTTDNGPLLTSLFLSLSLPRGLQLLLSCEAGEAFKTMWFSIPSANSPMHSRSPRQGFETFSSVHAKKSVLTYCCAWVYLTLCVWVKDLHPDVEGMHMSHQLFLYVQL